MATPPFRKILRAYVRTVSGNIGVKFEVRSFNRLELLAFNAEKFRGSRDPGHAPFSKKNLRVPNAPSPIQVLDRGCM